MFTYNPDISQPLNLHKVRFSFSPKLGRQFVFAKSFLFSYTFGLSFRIENTKILNKTPPGHSLELPEFFGYSPGPDYSKKEGQRGYLSGILNIKLGYIF